MTETEEIRDLIDRNLLDEAHRRIAALIAHGEENDELYFLRGNIYRKYNDWKNAMSDYCRAIEINPQSPAVEAYRSAEDIMNFFSKDLLNP